MKKLQILLGHASIATTMEYVDSSLEQLRCECEKLWKTDEDETTYSMVVAMLVWPSSI